MVRLFREVLLWPVQLIPLGLGGNTRSHWQVLAQGGEGNPWYPLGDRFRPDAPDFEERHYKEFVTFLPYIRRFLYGESRSHLSFDPNAPPGGSAIKIFRRDDVAAVRLVLRQGDAPIVLTVEHTELWFFEDINLAFLKLEVSGANIAMPDACELMYRFGRSYPTGWDSDGHGKHNVYLAEWLAKDGTVLVKSDSHNQPKFLTYTREHRSPGISAAWEFLLRPLAQDSSEQPGILRYRQIEYHRMPLMAFLAVENPRSMSRENWIRLGLVATLHPDEALPVRDADVTDFEARYCYDRFWTDSDAGPNTRFLCSGRAFVMVGDADVETFCDSQHGILAQFRHQYALLFLIAHFHRAALLIFAARMVDSVQDLDIRLLQSVNRFRRRVYGSFEAFLRFTHRYWFHELSERPHVQALYRMCSDHLGNNTLYQEVRDEMRDMSQYLDSNGQRQMSTTMVRLTVVTVFSMLGTVASGLLGMNLIADTDGPVLERIGIFLITLLATTTLMLIAILKSRQLSDVMDVLADDQKLLRARIAGIGNAWRRNR
ncbi:MAG: CorA family divalent cation transporter [Gallionellaceae bacterium]|jgi:hypothetical protein|nr:CorA family divalent cation transporter [Gallionellaceae bacterium]